MRSAVLRPVALATRQGARWYSAVAPRPETDPTEEHSSDHQDTPLGESSHNASSSSSASASDLVTSEGARTRIRKDKTDRPILPKRSPAQRAAFTNARNFALALSVAKQAIAGALPDTSSAQRSDSGVGSGNQGRRWEPMARGGAGEEEPTMKDLVEKRPKVAAPYDSPKYGPMYYALERRVASAFVKGQLRAFATQLDCRPGMMDSKRQIVRRILQSWGWEQPPKQNAGQTERVLSEYGISNLQLFFREKAALNRYTSSLVMSVVTEDHATLREDNTAQHNFYRLKVRGDEETIGQLEAHLMERKVATVTEFMPLAHLRGFVPTPSLLSAILQVFSAFVETKDDGLQISAYRADHVESAVGVLLRAAMQSGPVAPIRSIVTTEPASPSAATSSSPTTYAILPFSTPPNSPLPWPVSATAQGAPLGRLRVVEMWSQDADRAQRQASELFREAQVLPIAGQTGIPGVAGLQKGGVREESRGVELLAETLRSLSEGRKVEGDGATVRTRLRFGHALYPQASGSRSMLENPFPDAETLELPQHMEKTGEPYFAPSLTPALIHFPLSVNTRRTRRLLYRSIGRRIVPDAPNKYEMLEVEYVCAVPDRPEPHARPGQMVDGTADAGQASLVEQYGVPTESLRDASDAEWAQELEETMARFESEARERAALEGGEQSSDAEEAVARTAEVEEGAVDDLPKAQVEDSPPAVEAIGDVANDARGEEGVTSTTPEPQRPYEAVTAYLHHNIRRTLLHLPSRASDILADSRATSILPAEPRANSQNRRKFDHDVRQYLGSWASTSRGALPQNEADAVLSANPVPVEGHLAPSEPPPLLRLILDSQGMPVHHANADASSESETGAGSKEGRATPFALVTDEIWDEAVIHTNGVRMRKVRSGEPGLLWSKPSEWVEIEYDTPVTVDGASEASGQIPPRGLWPCLQAITADVPAGAGAATRELKFGLEKMLGVDMLARSTGLTGRKPTSRGVGSLGLNLGGLGGAGLGSGAGSGP